MTQPKRRSQVAHQGMVESVAKEIGRQCPKDCEIDLLLGLDRVLPALGRSRQTRAALVAGLVERFADQRPAPEDAS